MPFKVYYLDDEPGLLEIFVETFSSKNIEITTFEDPVRAIEEIKKNPPDLFFIDYRLPKITGDKIAQAVSPTIPKALIAGEISVKTETKFDAVFEKPYDSKAVESFIEEQYRSKKKAA